MKRKDNLTDIVENLRDKPAGASPKDGAWEVIGTNGELVTLGMDGGRPIQVRMKDGMLQMTPKQLQAIVQSAVKQGVDQFTLQFLKKVVEKMGARKASKEK